MATEILCGFGIDVDAVADGSAATAARIRPTIRSRLVFIVDGLDRGLIERSLGAFLGSGAPYSAAVASGAAPALASSASMRSTSQR